MRLRRHVTVPLIGMLALCSCEARVENRVDVPADPDPTGEVEVATTAAATPAGNVASPLTLDWQPCAVTPDGVVLGVASRLEHVGFSSGDRYLVLVEHTAGTNYRGRFRRGGSVLWLVSPEMKARACIDTSDVASDRRPLLLENGRYLLYATRMGEPTDTRVFDMHIVDLVRDIRYDLGDRVNWGTARLAPRLGTLVFARGSIYEFATERYVLTLSEGNLTRTGERQTRDQWDPEGDAGRLAPAARIREKLGDGVHVEFDRGACFLSLANGTRVALRAGDGTYWAKRIPDGHGFAFLAEDGICRIEEDGSGRRLLMRGEFALWKADYPSYAGLVERRDPECGPRLVLGGTHVLAEVRRPPPSPTPFLFGFADSWELWLLAIDGSRTARLAECAECTTRRVVDDGWLVYVDSLDAERRAIEKARADERRAPDAPPPVVGELSEEEDETGFITIARRIDGIEKRVLGDGRMRVRHADAGRVLLEARTDRATSRWPEEPRTVLRWTPADDRVVELVAGQTVEASDDGGVVLVTCGDVAAGGVILMRARVVRTTDGRLLDYEGLISNCALSRGGKYVLRYLAGKSAVLTTIAWER